MGPNIHIPGVLTILVTHLHTDTLEYFNLTHEIFDEKHPKEIPTGKYTIPFTFPLPHDIPDSFGGGEGSNCRVVRYFIRVVLNNSCPFVPDYKNECDVIVTRPYSCPQMPIAVPVESQLPTTMRFGKSGSVDWCVTLEKNVWKIGEDLVVKVLADESKLQHGINGAYAHLTQHVVALPNGTHNGSDPIQCVSHTSDTPQDKKSGTLTIRMKLPNNLQPTFHSDWVSCEYNLLVYLDVPLCESAMVKVPITIYRMIADEALVDVSVPATAFDYVEMMRSNRPQDAPPAYYL